MHDANRYAAMSTTLAAWWSFDSGCILGMAHLSLILRHCHRFLGLRSEFSMLGSTALVLQSRPGPQYEQQHLREKQEASREMSPLQRYVPRKHRNGCFNDIAGESDGEDKYDAIWQWSLEQKIDEDIECISTSSIGSERALTIKKESEDTEDVDTEADRLASAHSSAIPLPEDQVATEIRIMSEARSRNKDTEAASVVEVCAFPKSHASFPCGRLIDSLQTLHEESVTGEPSESRVTSNDMCGTRGKKRRQSTSPTLPTSQVTRPSEEPPTYFSFPEPHFNEFKDSDPGFKKRLCRKILRRRPRNIFKGAVDSGPSCASLRSGGNEREPISRSSGSNSKHSDEVPRDYQPTPQPQKRKKFSFRGLIKNFGLSLMGRG
jgi:hypothetical protein